MTALAALLSAESAAVLARDNRGDGPGQRGAHGTVFAAAPPPTSNAGGWRSREEEFADQGTELLSQLERALLAEARARPDACVLALGKAAVLLGEPAGASGTAECTQLCARLMRTGTQAARPSSVLIRPSAPRTRRSPRWE